MQFNPRLRGAFGPDVIDDVVSGKTEVPSGITGTSVGAIIDDVVFDPYGTCLGDGTTPPGEPFIEDVHDPLLSGRQRTVRVIYDDIQRELALGKVPENERVAWRPPFVTDPTIDEIRMILAISEGDVKSGKAIAVTNALNDAVNEVIHRFEPVAYAACGYNPRRGEFHGHMGCNFVQQIENVNSIIQGYGCTPVKAWVSELDRNTA